MASRDPVYEDSKNKKWYFYDETWSEVYGPYESESEARAALQEYCDLYLKD